jgi:hypothetical protein
MGGFGPCKLANGVGFLGAQFKRSGPAAGDNYSRWMNWESYFGLLLCFPFACCCYCALVTISFAIHSHPLCVCLCLCVCGWMDGWMEGRMDGCMGAWVYRWMLSLRHGGYRAADLKHTTVFY